MTMSHAERVQQAVDLKREIVGLRDVSDSEVIFQDTSPPKHWDFVWSTQTGERIRVARHRLESVLSKVLPNGRAMFTSREHEAPAYRLGEIKCFLAEGSKDRELVDSLRLSPGYYCPAEHLANETAARLHAEHRHPTSWRMFSEYKDRMERERDREERRMQTEAMLELAKGSARKGKGE